MSNPSTFFVTGASRGLGLAIVQSLLSKESTSKVFAGARNPGPLSGLSQRDPRLVIIDLDVSNEASIKAAAGVVASQTDSLSVLINNAAIAPEKTIPAASVPSTDLQNAFQVNTLGPILLMQAFIPLLKNSYDGENVVNISLTIGSLNMALGKPLAYSISKAALNMALYL